MDKKTQQTMVNNILKGTGKSLEDWIALVRKNDHGKHNQTVKWLKDEHNLGLFFADLIVHKAYGTDANSFSSDELITNQYKGKGQLKAVYDELISFVIQLGSDVEIAPKKAYVSLRRKKQFACLKPAAKTRFELELILKGQSATKVLELIGGAGAMCTHKIKIESAGTIPNEAYYWLTKAYERAI